MRVLATRPPVGPPRTLLPVKSCPRRSDSQTPTCLDPALHLDDAALLPRDPSGDRFPPASTAPQEGTMACILLWLQVRAVGFGALFFTARAGTHAVRDAHSLQLHQGESQALVCAQVLQTLSPTAELKGAPQPVHRARLPRGLFKSGGNRNSGMWVCVRRLPDTVAGGAGGLPLPPEGAQKAPLQPAAWWGQMPMSKRAHAPGDRERGLSRAGQDPGNSGDLCVTAKGRRGPPSCPEAQASENSL